METSTEKSVQLMPNQDVYRRIPSIFKIITYCFVLALMVGTAGLIKQKPARLSLPLRAAQLTLLDAKRLRVL